MMRAEIYKAIRKRLQERVPTVRYIDLWNSQITDIEGGVHFSTPAVFVEFEDIVWQQGAMGSRRGEVGIRLHIIDRYIPTDGSREGLEPLQYFDTIDKINEALWLLSGDRFAGLMLRTSSTDHEHKELIEDIEHWVCTATYPPIRSADKTQFNNINITTKDN